MKQRKYLKGGTILTIQELCTVIYAGNYVFFHDKPMNPGWVRSFQLGMTIGCLQHGVFSQALLNPDYREPTPRRK